MNLAINAVKKAKNYCGFVGVAGENAAEPTGRIDLLKGSNFIH